MAATTYLVWALPLFSIAMAQQDPTPTSTDATTTPTPSLGGSDTPNDAISNNDNDNHDTVGLVNYYFVFIALIVLAAFLAAFFMYKRKRRYGAIMSRGRETALQQDLNSWDPVRARRRYWQGRWRSAEIRQEEGLNEDGEAPPPYAPKSRDEETGRRTEVALPAVPLQTLSREQAGLKPPDYTEVQSQAVDGAPTNSEPHDHSLGTRPS